MASILDDINEGANSSDALDLDAAQEGSTEKVEATPSAEEAKSSTATGDDDKSLLDIVRDAVDKKQAKSDPASPAEAEEDGTDKQKKAEDNENFSDVPFHKHPRFQYVLRQKKAFQQDAERYQNVQRFLDDNGINADEAAEVLTVAALAKTNPAQAWGRIRPWVQNLLIAAGEVLPEDLQRRVHSGEFTAEAALELSRTQAALRSTQASTAFQREQEQRRAQAQSAQAIVDAATSWEQDRMARDPNFEAKLEPLRREILWLRHQEGVPVDPAGVHSQLNRAYQAVNAAFMPPAAPVQRQPAGQKPAMKPVTGGSVAGAQRQTERSTLDIIRSARA